MLISVADLAFSRMDMKNLKGSSPKNKQFKRDEQNSY